MLIHSSLSYLLVLLTVKCVNEEVCLVWYRAIWKQTLVHLERWRQQPRRRPRACTALIGGWEWGDEQQRGREQIERQRRFSQFPLVVRACIKNILRNRWVALSGCGNDEEQDSKSAFSLQNYPKENNNFMITPASLLSWFWWIRLWNARAATFSSRPSWKLRTRFPHS